MGKVKFPTIKAVAAWLREERDSFANEAWCNNENFRTLDVRLQVYGDADGRWALRVGSSDYDQDHRGYWGAASVGKADTVRTLRAVARDLIDQAKEQCGNVAN